MGNYSWLRNMLNGADLCHIHWDKMDPTKIQGNYTLFYEYDTHDVKDRAKTLAEMAERWDDTKLYGYLTNEHNIALKEFCRCLEPVNFFPRLYYEYEGWDRLVCFEFHPGTETILIAIFDFQEELKKEGVIPYNTSIPNWDQHYQETKERILKEAIGKNVWVWHKIS
jgi:hypothetical protein